MSNIIDRSLEVYAKHQRLRGVETDEVSFVAGFASCFGILTGRVNVGFPEDTSIIKLFELCQRNLDDYRARVVGAQSERDG